MFMQKHVLIITEKPDAARRIATALDVQHRPKVGEDNGVPYYVAERDRKIVIVPALGHLYTIVAEERGRDFYPALAFRWVPRYETEKKARLLRVWLATITNLARDADLFIDACDYDIEGSIIGYSILKHACNNKDRVARRMKYSTLTGNELEESYGKLLPHLDFALIEAGKTRHEVDWLYGVNLSRALTVSRRNWSGKYRVLSTGRVQGPVLGFLAAREASIRSFVPTPYWEVNARLEINRRVFEARYENIIKTKKDAELLMGACGGSVGQVERIVNEQVSKPPPPPFDLGGLQGEAYRLFGYAPRQTSNLAQRLYLDALISYPRTSSQKLPPTIDYRTILDGLGRLREYKDLTLQLLTMTNLKPKEGLKEDAAHPAIYPTGILPERALTLAERRIWDLVIRRFMAAFGALAIIETLKVYVNVEGFRFNAEGRRRLKSGWQDLYGPYVRARAITLPKMKEGTRVKVKTLILLERFTQPPARYNSSSIIRKMEKAKIGTKATRADIVQILYDRRYTTNERIEMTDLGFEVVEILRKYCSLIVSSQLTRDLEERMDRIQTNAETRENVLFDAVNILRLALKKLKENEVDLGEQLSKAEANVDLEARTVGSCPVCKTGKLLILHSRKTGKRFVGCSNYFKGRCKTSFPLPQSGKVKVRNKTCPNCEWPTIQILLRHRRPWALCLNPGCSSRQRRKKKSAV